MPALIPAPARTEVDGSPHTFALRSGAGIAASDELDDLAAQFIRDVATAGGPALTLAAHDGVHAVRLDITDDTTAFADLPDTLGVRPTDGHAHDERYGLDVSRTGIRVWARAPEGIARGLTTLRQLIGVHDATAADVHVPVLRIVDGPRFAWRGLSLDVARTFFSVDEVKSVVDLLAYYKLNVLHLHLTDDQGWRLRIDARPDLTGIGARGAFGARPGGFYTQDDYREIVGYAAARHVTVVPEIDLPGHCAAVFAAYPDLAPEGWDPAAGPLHLGALDPDDPATWRFVTDVFTEVAALTPGRYLHIGGDEAPLPDDAYQRFVTGVRKTVAGLGKCVVGWQEVARGGLAPGDVAQHWLTGVDLDGDQAPDFSKLPGGADLPEDFAARILPMIREMLAKADGDVALAVGAGAQVLLSPAPITYLDQPYRDAAPPSQEERRARLGFHIYPGNTLESAFDWEPSTHHAALPESAIAGVEAALWCESVEDFADAEFLLLPRLPGIAESAWSPHGSPSWDEYAGRLGTHAPVWRHDARSYFAATSVEWE